jgi:RsiW-degrading membrane proteinase PrsW (M82 family)
MAVMLAMVSAVVPSLLLLWFFHKMDTFPEPARVVWTTFALGVGSIIPVLIVGLPIMFTLDAIGIPSAGVHGFLQAFATAAVPEEAAKLAVLALYAGRHSAFDEPMDGLVYGAAASLGFATLENVLYCAQGGVGLAILRAFTAVPMHAGCGAIMGYYYGRSRFETDRFRLLALAYFVPMMLHGLYDWPLLAQGHLVGAGDDSHNVPLFGAGLFVLAIIVAWAFGTVLRARSTQARARVAAGSAPAPAAHASTASRIGGALLLLTGVLSAGTGGLFTLGILLMLLTGQVAEQERTNIMLGGAIIGVLPLAFGLALFAGGLKLLNRRAAPVSAPMQYAA